jgi:hypothetical protein
MFSSIRKRLTYANVAMTLALVLAMTGGAYAAGKIIITSTKQISPAVLKKLKGKTGAQGAIGPAGPEGKQGATGPSGPEGKQGPEGKEGKQGLRGETGQSGFTESLPEGKTEQGTWGVFDRTAVESSEEAAPISFSIPVAVPPTAHYIAAGTEETNDPAGCKGTSAKPIAEPGNLCVFALYEENAKLGFGIGFLNPEGTGVGSPGAGKSGSMLLLQAEKEGKMAAYGDWAVTAE